jgi:phosphate starvation-inducible protein PhoH and related proteins
MLKPRTRFQQHYVDMLARPKPPIVVATGPAGCGKTMWATLIGCDKAKDNEVDRIVVARPAVSVDEQHGFLPGKIDDKMGPWVAPIMDIMRKNLGQKRLTRMRNDGEIEFAPLAYMRGRTFDRSWIILDEAQNCTPQQVKMVLTRIGNGSKIVMTGDLDQHDRGFEHNGLYDFVNRLIHVEEDGVVGMVNFGVDDVQRHPVIPIILSLYDRE